MGIIAKHAEYGYIPESGNMTIFTENKELIDKTEEYFKSLSTKDREKAMEILSPKAYKLYCLLSPAICTQANKQLVLEGKQEWDISEKTSYREFYAFFTKAIAVAYEKERVKMSFNTDLAVQGMEERILLANNQRSNRDNTTKNSPEKGTVSKNNGQSRDEAREEDQEKRRQGNHGKNNSSEGRESRSRLGLETKGTKTL